MSKKIIFLLVGSLAAFAFILIVSYLIALPAKQAQTPIQTTPSEQAINAAGAKTSDLQNFANLPVKVGAEEVGRENPFESY